MFTFTELKTITENFKRNRVLGEGGFGSVFRGTIPKGMREGLEPLDVAVKVHDGERSFQGHREWLVRFHVVFLVFRVCLRSLTVLKCRFPLELQAEVIFLGQFSHPNLVKLIGYCCEEEHRVLIYEYMGRGSVEDNLFSSNYHHFPCSLISILLPRVDVLSIKDGKGLELGTEISFMLCFSPIDLYFYAITCQNDHLVVPYVV